MSKPYYEQYETLMKKIHEPFQAIAELNIKTLQGLSMVKPQDFAGIKEPGELLQKNLEVALANGQKALDHMQQTFDILEKTMLSISREAVKKPESDAKKP